MALVLWGGWTLLHYVIFATAQGTMHPYYTTALAPGIAALCGGGGVMLLDAFRRDRRWMWVLPAAFGVTGVWAITLLRRASGWNTWLWPTIGVLTVAAIVGMLVFRSGSRTRLLVASLTAAVVAALAGPTAYAASPALGSSGGMMGGTNPTAGPSTGGGPGGMRGGSGFPGGGSRAGGDAQGGFPGGQQGQNGELPGGGQMTPGGGTGELPQAGGTGQAPGGTGTSGGTAPGDTTPGGTGESGGTAGQRGGFGGGAGGGPGGVGGADSELISYLKKHQDGAKWLLAVSNSQSAAQIELSAREPVISMWGFTGSDNAMTVAKLKELVKKGELHYIQIGSGGMGGGMGGPGGGNTLSTQVSTWVKQHGTAVKASAYSKGSASTSSTSTASLYRLDPSDVS
jgi:hypothetical protein